MGWGGCQCGHQPLLGEEFRRRAGGARTHQDLVTAPHPLSGPMGIKGAASQSLSADNGSQAGWADLVLSETSGLWSHLPCKPGDLQLREL